MQWGEGRVGWGVMQKSRDKRDFEALLTTLWWPAVCII